MPRVIESHMPEIAGFAELDLERDPLRSYQGNLTFLIARGVIQIPEESTGELQSILEETEPIWSQTDEAFRDLHGIAGGVTVRHSLSIQNNASTAMTAFRDMLPLPPHMDLQTGPSHVDRSPRRKYLLEKYTWHPAASTEFFIGRGWFLPFNAFGYKFNAVAMLTNQLNVPFLAWQAHHALPFRPEAGAIVRIGRAVHRRAHRDFLDDGSEKLITDVVRTIEQAK